MLLFISSQITSLVQSQTVNIDETVESIRDRFEKQPPQDEQTKGSTNIVRVIEKELTAETDAIVRGFKEMTGRIDRDLKNSGEEEMKHLIQVLKSHSNDLRKRFREMNESIKQNVHEMMKESETVAASDDDTGGGFIQYLQKLG